MLTRSVGIFAWALFALALVLLVVTLRTPKSRPAGTDEVRMPAFAMEFVDSDAGLQRIIGNPGADPVAAAFRDRLMNNLKLDYGFIAVYWLLFVGIAGVLAQRGGAWALWVAGAAVMGATAAAGFDVMENLRMTRVLETMHVAGNDVASAGFLKWLFSFLTLALLSFAFFGRGGWGMAAGVACLVTAAVGMAGLAAIRAGVHKTWPVEVAFALMMFVLLPLVASALTLGRAAFAAGPG
jgi:hypothetical protein